MNRVVVAGLAFVAGWMAAKIHTISVAGRDAYREWKWG